MDTEHKNNCLVCGSELVYHSTAEPMDCLYCKKTFPSNVGCSQGHYICDACHSMGAFEVIKEFGVASDSTDPMQMAKTLMHHPSVKMHGPEHHYLVPAVLLVAYYNKKGNFKKKKRKLKEAFKRAGQVLGGFCGFHGSCGAGVGTGIFISLITDSTPLSTDGWRMSNLMTSQSLASIAERGGPRCCKRTSFLAIRKAIRFLKENFDISLNAGEPVRCEFFPLNKECLKNDCPFYPKAENPMLPEGICSH